ncbi:hypothetical protein IAR50_005922 [Cryptococcus sp. DSM 104548]
MALISLVSTPNRRRFTAISLVLLLSLFLTYNFAPSARRHLGLSPETDLPLDDQEYTLKEGVSNGTPRRVAIVGAGASGSSAAFFMRRAAHVAERRANLPQGSLLGDIIVYEQGGYVGGRTTTVYPHGDQRARPQELGASIFVEANQNMMKAAKVFNLTLVDPDFGESGVGIWDGQQFLFQSSSSDWLTSARAIWRYGPLAPLRTRRAVDKLLLKFKQLYNPKWLRERGPVGSIDEFAERVGLGTELTSRSGESWAKEVLGVGEKWIGEVWEGSTRVNYAINIDKIQALAAGVSMATNGASQIEGGNWQIFRSMVDDADVNLHLATTVNDIVPFTKDGKRRLLVKSNATQDEEVDSVFWAAPWKSDSVKSVSSRLTEPIPPTPYVRLHVTYITTTKPHPDPSFFGLPEGTVIPSTILTSAHPPARGSLKSSPLPPPRFQSITWHGPIFPGSSEFAVKIFSLTRLSDRFLRQMLGEEPGWLLRKEWDSYPRMVPVSGYPAMELTEGVQYLGGMERWVSTMETQTISAREAVGRVVDQWWGLGLGECENGDSWDWTC